MQRFFICKNCEKFRFDVQYTGNFMLIFGHFYREHPLLRLSLAFGVWSLYSGVGIRCYNVLCSFINELSTRSRH